MKFTRLTVATLALVGVLAGGAFLSGCATAKVQERQDKAVTVAIDVVARVGKIVEEAQTWEIQLHNAGAIKDPLHLTLQTAFAKASATVQASAASLPSIQTAEGAKQLTAAVRGALEDIVKAVAPLTDASSQRLTMLLNTAQALIGLSIDLAETRQ